MAWVCKRITYRNRKAAQRALQQILRTRRRMAAFHPEQPYDQHERHAYRCRYCGAWHLTSGRAEQP